MSGPRGLRNPACQASGLPLSLWMAYWKTMARYLRYEVEGFENLLGPAALLVGYHGRPVAWDMCLLSTEVHRRLGYMLHGIFHGTFKHFPGLDRFIDGLGCVFGDDPRLPEVIRRGEHIATVPGGTREAYRPFTRRYQVDWGRRLGYLRFAARHRLPLIPVGASGVDHLYLGLNDGYRLGKRLGMPGGIPVWAGLGPLGLCPFSPPFPFRVRQRIGPPITDTAEGRVAPDDDEALLALHGRVTGAVQQILDRQRDMLW